MREYLYSLLGTIPTIYAGGIFCFLGLRIVAANFPSCVLENFGKKEHGAIMGFFNGSYGVAQLILNLCVAAPLYSRYATADGGKTCYGKDCFRTTFYIFFGISTAALIPAVLWAYRSREFYRKMYRAMQQDDSKNKLEEEKSFEVH